MKFFRVLNGVSGGQELLRAISGVQVLVMEEKQGNQPTAQPGPAQQLPTLPGLQQRRLQIRPQQGDAHHRPKMQGGGRLDQPGQGQQQQGPPHIRKAALVEEAQPIVVAHQAQAQAERVGHDAARVEGEKRGGQQERSGYQPGHKVAGAFINQPEQVVKPQYHHRHVKQPKQCADAVASEHQPAQGHQVRLNGEFNPRHAANRRQRRGTGRKKMKPVIVEIDGQRQPVGLGPGVNAGRQRPQVRQVVNHRNHRKKKRCRRMIRARPQRPHHCAEKK